MYRHSVISSLIAAAALSVGALTISHAGVALRQAPPQDRLETPLPRPVAPPATLTALPECGTFQLVGFTEESFDGRGGILNYTLSCQKEFPNSRICTRDEIDRTVHVPSTPGTGHAWVDSSDSGRPRDAAANCRGWMSSSSGDSGKAIDLSASYGALVNHSCDQPLRLACCAIMPN